MISYDGKRYPDVSNKSPTSWTCTQLPSTWVQSLEKTAFLTVAHKICWICELGSTMQMIISESVTSLSRVERSIVDCSGYYLTEAGLNDGRWRIYYIHYLTKNLCTLFHTTLTSHQRDHWGIGVDIPHNLPGTKANDQYMWLLWIRKRGTMQQNWSRELLQIFQ